VPYPLGGLFLIFFVLLFFDIEFLSLQAVDEDDDYENTVSDTEVSEADNVTKDDDVNTSTLSDYAVEKEMKKCTEFKKKGRGKINAELEGLQLMAANATKVLGDISKKRQLPEAGNDKDWSFCTMVYSKMKELDDSVKDDLQLEIHKLINNAKKEQDRLKYANIQSSFISPSPAWYDQQNNMQQTYAATQYRPQQQPINFQNQGPNHNSYFHNYQQQFMQARYDVEPSSHQQPPVAYSMYGPTKSFTSMDTGSVSYQSSPPERPLSHASNSDVDVASPIPGQRKDTE
jgi:hypothetical protein